MKLRQRCLPRAIPTYSLHYAIATEAMPSPIRRRPVLTLHFESRFRSAGHARRLRSRCMPGLRAAY